jgi:hypothetical protein
MDVYANLRIIASYDAQRSRFAAPHAQRSERKASVNNEITTSGIDVAKSVFQVHGVDERGDVVLRRQIRRSQLLLFFGKLEPCPIGMEACASSHYWARKLTALDHNVRLMAPQFVKPYRKNDKNDGNDAEAICEAAQRPSMRFVPVKSPEQQAELAVHRVRRRLMRELLGRALIETSDVRPNVRDRFSPLLDPVAVLGIPKNSLILVPVVTDEISTSIVVY